MSNFFEERYLVNYNNFIEQLGIMFNSDETNKLLDNLQNLPNQNKLENGISFANSFNDENFELFVKNKIKVFSHKSDDTRKISESLLGSELCLKNLLNNQPEEVKEVIWTNLHTLLLMSELLKSKETQNDNRIEILSKVITRERGLPEEDYSTVTNKGKKKLKEMFGSDLNKETTEMLDDIVGSFESLLTGNPASSLGGIMEISKKITEKYADKINSGSIELDKLMEAIGKKVPGMDKMLGGMKDMMKKEPEKPKEKIIIDENFSTANVEVGQVKEDTSNFNIGNMLKMVQNFTGNSNDQGDTGIPHMGKMLEMMQRLDQAKTPEDADTLKKEMDEFLQNELGLDVNQLNEQIDEVTKEMKEQPEK